MYILKDTMYRCILCSTNNRRYENKLQYNINNVQYIVCFSNLKFVTIGA